MSQMLLIGNVLVLFYCVGLAVVPGVQSSECTRIPSYNYLNDFLNNDKCESVDLVFSYLHNITEITGNGRCRKDIINKLASHYGTDAHTPDHCQCSGTFKLQDYSRSPTDGIPDDLADRCNLRNTAYRVIYNQFFASSDQPQNLVCRTHHSIWTYLRQLDDDHSCQHDIVYHINLWTYLRQLDDDHSCQHDIVYHINYAFSEHGDPCSCSENTATATTSTRTTTTTTTTSSQQTTMPTTTTTQSDVTTSPRDALPQCNHTCTLYAVAIGKTVVSANATGCARPSEFASDEALLITCCSLGIRQGWRKGQPVQQTGVCIKGEIPYYTPVSLYNGQAVTENHAGIFVGCIADGQSGFKMIIQDCNTAPTVIFVNGSDGIDPNNYFAIF